MYLSKANISQANETRRSTNRNWAEATYDTWAGMPLASKQAEGRNEEVKVTKMNFLTELQAKTIFCEPDFCCVMEKITWWRCWLQPQFGLHTNLATNLALLKLEISENSHPKADATEMNTLVPKNLESGHFYRWLFEFMMMNKTVGFVKMRERKEMKKQIVSQFYWMLGML